MRKCLHCERQFKPSFDTDAFCSTYCSHSWWAYTGSGDEWSKLEPRLIIEWNAFPHLY